MLKYVPLLVFCFLLIGCLSRFEAPKLEFVSLRHFHLQDTMLFKITPNYPYVLNFTSDKDFENCGYDNAPLLIYASARKRGFNFHDVRSDDIREDEVFSGIDIKKIGKRNGKYYYAAALYLTLSKDDFRYVNDTVYCKIFYVRMFQSKPQTEEMKIPKDSLNILFE